MVNPIIICRYIHNVLLLKANNYLGYCGANNINLNLFFNVYELNIIFYYYYYLVQTKQ